ncbi:hypothetical protein [Sphingobacterium lumbrici]|uniref:hypothetical protein n=1 Tax=Sphingobacterium lumbrici TaxID=2559600 RepID=UPI00112DFDE5|nr:hypothetical protein [Sphingobacterium lumbrici]
MMNRVLLLMLLCCHFLYVKANENCHVSGRLIDSTSLVPLQEGLLNISNSVGEIINVVKSDSGGNFTFTADGLDDLLIEVRVMGYAVKKVKISKQELNRDSLKIGNIYLQSQEIKLQEVTVTGKQNLISQEIGKIIYNVQGDPENQFQNMFDMLRKVPLISMSAEDDILMAGKANFKVLINGKTSALTVGKPSEIFRTIPAKLVQRIEVITQPPAKYDGEGIGGIINVIMNQKLIQGYLGGINAGSGKMNSNVSGNFAIRSNKISLSTFINSFWEYPPESFLSSQIERDGQIPNSIEQEGKLKNRANSKVGAITFGYEIDSLNLLMIGGNLKGKNHDRTNLLSTLMRTGNKDISFFTDNTFGLNGNGGSIDLNYERGFKRHKQQLLTFSLNYNKQSNKQDGQNIYSERVNFEDQDFQQINNSSLTYAPDELHI